MKTLPKNAKLYKLMGQYYVIGPNGQNYKCESTAEKAIENFFNNITPDSRVTI
jgi:hypothetical protein